MTGGEEIAQQAERVISLLDGVPAHTAIAALGLAQVTLAKASGRLETPEQRAKFRQLAVAALDASMNAAEKIAEAQPR